MTSFKTLWASRYGVIPPIGYRIRDALSARWTRLHALPNSKQYADCDDERAVIVSRANRLATDMFGEGRPFWLASSRLRPDPSFINYEPDYFARLNWDLPESFTWKDYLEEPEDRLLWDVHAASLIWRENAFDSLFQKIANEEEFEIIFVSHDMDYMLAPYDGGFDLVLPNSEMVAEWTTRFSDWRPL